jgi:hypothetical protein
LTSTARHIWRNFFAFWKSQVLCCLVAAVIAFTWQYRQGLLARAVSENLWAVALPYLGIAAVFLVVNLGHAIFRAELETLRKREREEHRANRKAEIERSKTLGPKPNLQFGRVFLAEVFVGHEISGRSYPAWVVEVRNELSDRDIGPATNIRALIIYKEIEGNRVLHTLCPAQWGAYQPKIGANIRQGESCALILAHDRGNWFSDLSKNGVLLPESAIFEARLIDQDGKYISPIQSFEFRTTGLGGSECSKV